MSTAMESEKSYRELPRIRRLAMFLVVMGPDAAADVLRGFDRDQADRIAREMASVELIDEATQTALVEEFSGVLVESFAAVRGGYDVALRTLELARGDAQARAVVGEPGGAEKLPDGMAAVAEMEPDEIAGLLDGEQTQTVAFILSSLEPRKAAAVLMKLDEEEQADVVLKMGTIGPTPSAVMRTIVRNLEGRSERRFREPRQVVGGAGRVADVLKCLGRDAAKGMMAQLTEKDAALATRVGRGLFSFDDLTALANQDLQRVLRDVESATLVTAMKPAGTELKEKILGALSKRAAESLREELEFLGPVRRSEVDAARDAIVETVFRLEEGNEITLGDGGDDVIE